MPYGFVPAARVISVGSRPKRAARARHLVRPRDVHGAEGVLVELGHLGRLARGDDVHARGHGADDLRRLPRAPVGDATDDTRHVALVPVPVARVDPLGRERHEHLAPRSQAALGQRLREQLLRAADVRGARQHDHLVAPRVRHDRLAGGAQHPQVGLEAIVDRRRDADHHRVRRLERTGARREHELVELECRLQALPLSDRKVHAALTNVLQPALAHVDPGHLGSPRSPARSPSVGRRSRVPAPPRTRVAAREGVTSGCALSARASGVVTEPFPMAMWGQRLDGRHAHSYGCPSRV